MNRLTPGSGIGRMGQDRQDSAWVVFFSALFEIGNERCSTVWHRLGFKSTVRFFREGSDNKRLITTLIIPLNPCEFIQMDQQAILRYLWRRGIRSPLHNKYIFPLIALTDVACLSRRTCLLGISNVINFSPDRTPGSYLSIRKWTHRMYLSISRNLDLRGTRDI